MPPAARFASLALFAASAFGQAVAARHNFEFAAAGILPLGGWRAEEYSAGPGWRAGYELRVVRHLGAEVGFTEAWPLGIETCGSYGSLLAA